MTKKVTPLTWQKDLTIRFNNDIQAIDDDFILFDNVKFLPAFDYPFRVDMTTVIICTKGTTRGKIGIKSYETTAPCMIIARANEILQYEYISDDFEGLFISMSIRLTDSIIPNSQERLPIERSVWQNASIFLDSGNLNLLKTYYFMLKTVVEMTENPNRKNIVRHLMIAFYYHSSSCLHNVSHQEGLPSKQNEFVERFLSLVEKHYKEERQVAFYADKLGLTPKYLSKLIKANTGKFANDWIDEYVMLEAKVLLKSTNMTVQQISDELNFTDQSIFGKYFKRQEGVSPKEYKRN